MAEFIERKISEDDLEKLIDAYQGDGHMTPIKNQTLWALIELKEYRRNSNCEHNIPRKFCTGMHK